MIDYPFDHAWWIGCILLGGRLHTYRMVIHVIKIQNILLKKDKYIYYIFTYTIKINKKIYVKRKYIK